MRLRGVYEPKRRRVTVTSGAGDESMASLRRLVAAAVDLIMPVPCLECGRETEGAGRQLVLCRPCLGRLTRWPDASCAVCGRVLAPPVPANYRCGRCRLRQPCLSTVTCAWTYGPPIDAVIGALKFRRLDAVGPHLGRLAATTVAEALPTVTAVTPVPLHPLRRTIRGYDQARMIARGVAQALGLPLIDTLRRRRRTAPQSRLPRARRIENPHGAFAVGWRIVGAGRRKMIASHRWLLVDDVVTTGATLTAAARALRAAGAPEVHGFACARAMEEPGL